MLPARFRGQGQPSATGVVAAAISVIVGCSTAAAICVTADAVACVSACK